MKVKLIQSIQAFTKRIQKAMELKAMTVKCTLSNKVRHELSSHQLEFGLGKLYFPKDFSGDIMVVLSNNTQESIPLKTLKEEIENENTAKEILKLYPKSLSILKETIKDIDNIKELEYGKFDLEKFYDITDYELNNFAQIPRASIESDGLWIDNGIRKIQLQFTEDITSLIGEQNDTQSISLGACFYAKNNDTLDKKQQLELKGEILYGKFFILLDTDQFSSYFEDKIALHTFFGEIKLSFMIDPTIEANLYFPFNIKIKNPAWSNEHRKTDLISIDFGTSSTCIAKNGGRDLISFNDHPQTIEDYENMTAMILYNWREIYAQWRIDNPAMPHFKRSKHSAEETDIKAEYYNYGDTIKAELKEAPDTKTLDAIITNLKALPGKLEDNQSGKEEVIPFDKEDFKRKVYLTDGIGTQNEETLNPIALYGYLIGRALNLQISNAIYTQYEITVPVNFNKYKREKIRTSLEFGLKRSLPKGLQDELKVSIGYEESIALLGAAKKLKHLKIPEEKKATLFAVFDFGGGTVDFAFGLYRKASDDSKIALYENEYETCNEVIEIFKTDGEMIGGEVLIDALSYKIYQDNKEIMKKEQISIAIPNDEKEIENHPKNLMGKRHIDIVNLKSISEKFSRPFFIHGEFDKDKNPKVELFSIEDSDKGIEIEMEKLNQEEADEFLKEKISKIIQNFYLILMRTFADYQERIELFGYDVFDIKNVKIIQAGNSCKAKWVKSAFDEFFEDHQSIIFLDDKKRNITPKNAVAKGALMLQEIKVYNHSKSEQHHAMPLDRYLWDINDVDENGEEAKPILVKGDNFKSGWKILTIRTNNTFRVYYSQAASVMSEDNLMQHTITIPDELIDEIKYTVCIRSYDGALVECALSNRKMESIDESKKIIIDLNSGAVTK